MKLLFEYRYYCSIYLTSFTCQGRDRTHTHTKTKTKRLELPDTGHAPANSWVLLRRTLGLRARYSQGQLCVNFLPKKNYAIAGHRYDLNLQPCKVSDVHTLR